MNITHLEHTLIALAAQVVLALATDNWWLGAAFGSMIFVVREHTQAERKARDAGHRYPELTVLYDRRYWSLDAVLDFALPCFATAALALLLTKIK